MARTARMPAGMIIAAAITVVVETTVHIARNHIGPEKKTKPSATDTDNATAKVVASSLLRR